MTPADAPGLSWGGRRRAAGRNWRRNRGRNGSKYGAGRGVWGVPGTSGTVGTRWDPDRATTVAARGANSAESWDPVPASRRPGSRMGRRRSSAASLLSAAAAAGVVVGVLPPEYGDARLVLFSLPASSPHSGGGARDPIGRARVT